MMHRLTDGQTDRRKNERTNGWTDRRRTCKAEQSSDHSVAARLREGHEEGEDQGRGVVDEHLNDGDVCVCVSQSQSQVRWGELNSYGLVGVRGVTHSLTN